MAFQEPHRDCDLCPRLRAFLLEKREELPSYHNAPVPSFGDPDPKLLIVGLAPGMHGANQTGRPLQVTGRATFSMPRWTSMALAKAHMAAQQMTG